MAKTHFTGPLQVGEGSMPQANTDGFRGAPLSHLYVYELLAPVAASSALIFASTTVATGNGANLFTTSTSTFATSGIPSTSGSTHDYERCVVITSTGDMSGATFTGVCTDMYGVSVTVTLTGPNNAAVTFPKPVKAMTSLAYNATSATGIPFRVGLNESFGLPYHALRSSKIVAISVDGEPHTSTGTVFTAPLTATGTASATTASARGIVSIVSEVPNASINYAITQLIDPTSSTSLYGAAQA